MARSRPERGAAKPARALSIRLFRYFFASVMYACCKLASHLLGSQRAHNPSPGCPVVLSRRSTPTESRKPRHTSTFGDEIRLDRKVKKERNVRDARARRPPRVRVVVVVVVLPRPVPRARRVETLRRRPRPASERDPSSRAREIRRAVEEKRALKRWPFTREREASETRTRRA